MQGSTPDSRAVVVRGRQRAAAAYVVAPGYFV